jgi:peptide chain release factor 1
MIPTEKLNRVVQRHDELARSMVGEGPIDPESFARVSKEYSDLGPVVDSIRELLKAEQEAKDLSSLIAEPGTDGEMKALAEDELRTLKSRLPELERQVKVLLLPKDENDERNAILEVRAGTGGDEAALFAAELFGMYLRYAELRKWKPEILSISETGLGGYKEASMGVSGRGVFARLKFESGVHRVQRVPATETSGRIHTSAATVAVLPEVEDVDIHIDDKDLRIDVYRASGPGGQGVNTTDSAVRITHLPSGIVVQQQDDRSQIKNKAKALKILRARLYEAERAKREAERAAARKSQVGTGDRSDKIRTYNFPQNRVTDHRIGLTIHKLDAVMAGDLDLLIAPMREHVKKEKLAAVSR